MLAGEIEYDDLEIKRYMDKRAMLGEKLNNNVSCFDHFHAIRTHTCALYPVQFSPRIGSQWDHFTWCRQHGRHHWRLTCRDETIHIVGSCVKRNQSRCQPLPPSRVKVHFPIPPHAAYECNSHPTQRITCGRGAMQMSYGPMCDIFWRRVETEDVSAVYPFPLGKPFLCICDYPDKGVLIFDMFDYAVEGTPMREYLIGRSPPDWAWTARDFLLWDGKTLIHIHRFPNIVIGSCCGILRIYVDWDIFEMRAGFAVYKQHNLPHNHIFDPYMASHAASYFCRLCKHYLCHRIDEYPWSNDRMFRIYYNTPEELLSSRMPISTIFDRLLSSKLGHIISNPPFDMTTTDTLVCALRRFQALFDQRQITLVLLSPPLRKFRSWLSGVSLTVANEFIRSDLGGGGRGMLRLKSTTTMLYTNTVDYETGVDTLPKFTNGDYKAAECDDASESGTSSTESISASIEDLWRMGSLIDDNKHAHGDRCDCTSFEAMCSEDALRLRTTAVAEPSCRTKSKTSRQKQRLVFALTAPAIEGIESLLIQEALVSVKEVVETEREGWYLIHDLYADATSCLSNKALSSMFKARMVPGMTSLLQHSTSNDGMLSVLVSWQQFLRKLNHFVFTEESRLGLTWQAVGTIEPPGGKMLTGGRWHALGESLQRGDTFFTQDQWEDFKIEGLLATHFIKKGQQFFKPIDQSQTMSRCREYFDQVVAVDVMTGKRKR